MVESHHARELAPDARAVFGINDTIMKPTHQITSTLKDRRTFPKTDCQYQSTLDASRATATETGSVKLRPIWKLSSGFFAGEAVREYVSELLLFVAMAGLSAWPIVFALHAITRMVRNY